MQHFVSSRNCLRFSFRLICQTVIKNQQWKDKNYWNVLVCVQFDDDDNSYNYNINKMLIRIILSLIKYASKMKIIRHLCTKYSEEIVYCIQLYPHTIPAMRTSLKSMKKELMNALAWFHSFHFDRSDANAELTLDWQQQKENKSSMLCSLHFLWNQKKTRIFFLDSLQLFLAFYFRQWHAKKEVTKAMAKSKFSRYVIDKQHTIRH